jgi:pimeloyl-ACP methyl ester carboxylesterase
MATICGHDSESVLTARLGPGALDIARAESAFFFADELPAVREWAFGPDEAAGITAPAHVVMGADSLQPTLMEQSVQRLAAMLGNARVEMLSGCTHLMPLQQPVALSQLITKFVTGVTAAL